MPERLIIVGGVAGGMTAATWARRESPHIDITVIEQGEDVSYSECGMPYVWGGAVANLDELIRYQPADLKAKYNLEVLNNSRAIRLNTSQQSLEIEDLKEHKQQKLYYDYLVIATGARPVKPDLPGSDLLGLFSVRHMPDARALDQYLKTQSPQHAVIIGGSFLGIEMAEALRARGMKVSLMERSGLFLKGQLDTFQEAITNELTKAGVDLYFNCEVTALAGEQRVSQVVTNNQTIAADMVVLATGVAPMTTLASDAGIRLGASGAIAVKETQQTNIPNVYAAGDCCEVHHIVSDRPVYFPLGTTANKQGRIAGINAAGGRAIFKGIAGTSVLKAFNLEIARTGLTVAEAHSAGFAARVLESRSVSRAGYYPGAQPVDVRVVYDDRTGRLLGAQMIGREGIAKRIDIFATALYSRLKVEDLLNLDLSYAPPFAPVWDPVSYVARKIDK